jgi:hypothetical protein
MISLKNRGRLIKMVSGGYAMKRIQVIAFYMLFASVLVLSAQTSLPVSPEAERLIKAAAAMVDYREIVTGACWDFVNSVYLRAGFPATARVQIYLTNVNGPYAPLSMIRPGDWLYINAGRDHSVLFVKWAPKKMAEGLPGASDTFAVVYEYEGDFAESPGQMSIMDVARVYGIIRPKTDTAWTALPEPEAPK